MHRWLLIPAALSVLAAPIQVTAEPVALDDDCRPHGTIAGWRAWLSPVSFWRGQADALDLTLTLLPLNVEADRLEIARLDATAEIEADKAATFAAPLGLDPEAERAAARQAASEERRRLLDGIERAGKRIEWAEWCRRVVASRGF